jgi:hypothetical protein
MGEQSDTVFPGPRDVSDEVAAGRDGTGEAFDHVVPDDGSKRRTSRYGPEKSRNVLKPGTRENSGDR